MEQSRKKLNITIPEKCMFLLTEKSRYKVLYGGRGCVDGETIISTPNGDVKIKDFNGGKIYACENKRVVEAYACKPIKYEPEPLYKVWFDGGFITVTAKHRFFTQRGWVECRNLTSNDFLSFCDKPQESLICHQNSILGNDLLRCREDALHCWNKLVSCLYHYLQDYHQCDAQLLEEVNTAQDVFQQLADDKLPCHLFEHMDDFSPFAIYDLFCLSIDRLSSLSFLQGEVEKNCKGRGNYSAYKSFEQLFRSFRQEVQSLLNNNPEMLVQGISKQLLALYSEINQDENLKKAFDILFFSLSDSSYQSQSDSYYNPFLKYHNPHYITLKKVCKVDFYKTDYFYDFFVPYYNNYIGNGIINHNSAKTESVGRALIIEAMKRKIRVLCARQTQASMSDSVHRVLCDIIHELGLEWFFTITRDSIRGLNGSDFFFKGIKQNVAEIKSTKGVNICWCEEADAITEESWDVLIPTIREPESEIWITFNPNMKSDATYQKFVVNKPDNCIAVEMNYVDNPFFPDVLREEMEFCKKLNYPKYEHIWLGIPNAEAGNLIKMSMFQRYKQPPERFDGLFITCDTAFSEKKSADNSAFLLGGVKGKQKYILDVYCKKVTFVDLCRDLKSFYLNAVEKYGRVNNLDAIYIENKASGISLIQQLRAEGLPILELTPTVHNEVLKKDIVADKYTRFLEIEAELDSGNVSIPESAPWIPEFERQCEAFTGGKQDEHDDCVDCCIYFLKMSKKYGGTNWDMYKQAFRL